MKKDGQVHELADIIQDLFNVLLFQKTQTLYFWQPFIEVIRVAARYLWYVKCQCEYEKNTIAKLEIETLSFHLIVFTCSCPAFDISENFLWEFIELTEFNFT